VIPNGVDIDKFDPDRYDRAAARRKTGIGNEFILGYVGSYMKWHGLETSLDTIELLAREKLSYHLVLIGTGSQHRHISREIEARGLQKHVTQMGTIPHASMPEYLAMFDLALMTYPAMEKFYFSPLKMYEYLSMGIPVVSTDIGQIGEVLAHRKTGMLVHEPTAVEFARAITTVAEDTGLLNEMRNNARQDAERNHSWLANARSVVELCEEALNPQCAPDQG
jgi:glycosyltransferase involved in cell wall biosynthesis